MTARFTHPMNIREGAEGDTGLDEDSNPLRRWPRTPRSGTSYLSYSKGRSLQTTVGENLQVTTPSLHSSHGLHREKLAFSLTYLLPPYPPPTAMLASESTASGTGPLFRSQPCVDAIDEANMNRGLVALFDASARFMRYRVPRMFGSNVVSDRLKSICQALWMINVTESRIC